MCIIVDNNKLNVFLADPADEDSMPVRKWLDRGAGSIVYSTGGKFAEIPGRAKAKLARYVQAGKARRIPGNLFADDERDLKARADVRSDDPHVLALARATGVRLLYTADGKLKSDFKNKNIIDRPRGKVYSGARNAALLTRSVCASSGPRSASRPWPTSSTPPSPGT